MPFVHLHVHSHYSLLDGLAKIDELVQAAKNENMKALALTDHGSMYGIIEFYQKATKAGIHPILGSEVYVSRGSRHQKRARLDDKPYHLVLLAKNNTGYQNLMQLTTLAHTEGFYYKPRVDYELLEKYSSGIIALSGCLTGEIARTIITFGLDKAKQALEKYLSIFHEDNFYLEMQHSPNLPDQAIVNDVIIKLSKQYNVPLVATNDVHYIKPEDAEAQDVLTCIQIKKTIHDTNRFSMIGEDFSFSSGDGMLRNFHYVPEAIHNTLKIADQCDVKIEFGKIRFPHYTPPKKIPADEYLRSLAFSNIPKRYHFDPNKEKFSDAEKSILTRVNYELEQISKMGFSGYLLIVQDFINWAKSRSIMVGPGRGSAAGSIVCYLTHITNIDPLRYDLIFERFLNPERIAMPDIDTDFADVRRDEVLQYVEEKYGKDHVAQIATFGTMAARAAVRDSGRALGFPYSYCDKLAKLIPMFCDLSTALETVTDLKQVYDSENDAKTILNMAKKLEGVARHASVHACGVLITDEPLPELVPVQYISQEKRDYVSQYSLHPIDDLGLLKLDFLGLRNLTILEKAVEIIEKTMHERVDIESLPLQDKPTFDLLQRGETTGIFQLESSGMKRYLKELRPTEIDDIIAMVALYRPGPMELIPDYIAGKHKLKKITYLHQKLEPILSKTYGIAIYQEQVLRIARDIAGFSLGEADVLRKAIGKKIKELLMEQKKKFIERAMNNGVSGEIAKKLFEFIEPFAQYGFNKSHAAAYALIAYQTAYLKANYPSQFMSALLTCDQDNIDRISIEVEECRRMNIEVLAPDVNESFSTFTVVKESLSSQKARIRFGLGAIKNIGNNIVRVIIDERKKKGHYKDLFNFLQRVQSKDLNKKSLESLAKSGALDKLAKRGDVLANVEQLLRYAKNIERDQKIGQKNMFGLLPRDSNAAEPNITLAQSPDISKQEQLSWEKELLGLYISDHPLKEIQEQLKGVFMPIYHLTHRTGNATIIAVITDIQRIVTRNGKPMLFINLEDTTGKIEGLVFPKLYDTTQTFWNEGKIVIANGKVNDKDGETKFILDHAEEYNPNKDYNARNGNQKNTIAITIQKGVGKKELLALKQIFDLHPGLYPLHLHFATQTGYKKVIPKTRIDNNKEIVEAIEKIVGAQCVHFE